MRKQKGELRIGSNKICSVQSVSGGKIWKYTNIQLWYRFFFSPDNISLPIADVRSLPWPYVDVYTGRREHGLHGFTREIIRLSCIPEMIEKYKHLVSTPQVRAAPWNASSDTHHTPVVCIRILWLGFLTFVNVLLNSEIYPYNNLNLHFSKNIFSMYIRNMNT